MPSCSGGKASSSVLVNFPKAFLRSVTRAARAASSACDTGRANGEPCQQDNIFLEAYGNSAARTISGLDPAIHPPAKEIDRRVEPTVTDVVRS
jgi:hypothetical protein